jgi:mRNA-degrading endonuclease RelE of RelBE toxin-antitoxin system
MEFIEASPFTRYLSHYLDDEAYRSLQVSLATNPERGDVMPGTGGLRKARFQDPKRQKGRRGGLRVIYYYFATDQQIWLMTLYGKDEADDLSSGQKRQLRLAIETEIKRRAQSARRKDL